jgi:hypothetical protein
MKCCPEAIPEQKSSSVLDAQDVGLSNVFDPQKIDPESEIVNSEINTSLPPIITHSPVLRL